jgi:hypothetical protein
VCADSGGAADLGVGARRLIESLEEAGVRLIWSPISELHHTEVAPLLLECDGVIAFEEQLWPSTYHAMEVTFALGETSWDGDGRPLRDTPLPVFAFEEDPQQLHRSWLWRNSRIVQLPRYPHQAASKVLGALGARCPTCDGSGKVSASPPADWDEPDYGALRREVCPRCEGSGRISRVGAGSASSTR